MHKEKNNLFLNVFFKKKYGVHNLYESLILTENNNVSQDSENSQYFPPNANDVLYVSHVPDFFQVKLKEVDKFHLKRFHQQKGYAADLSNFLDIDSYLKSQFKKNAKTIRRFVNRLESCFDIEYKLFYGQIGKNEYDQLLHVLRSMIVQRFQQRNEQSKSLLEWERTVALTYPLILKKRASLFVIYNGDKPIEIAINYHFKQILFSYISSYDIDYAKFGLGHVEIYKQLEWCLENKYNRFEMGWGDLDYKRRWSNHIYNFEQHLFYPKKSFPAKIKFKIKKLAIRVKLYLISKNVHIHFRNLKKRIRHPENSNSHYKDYEIIPIVNNSMESEGNKIDHRLESFAFLRKIIIDFLYGSVEHTTTVEVFECQEDNAFIIKGLHHAQKVVFRT